MKWTSRPQVRLAGLALLAAAGALAMSRGNYAFLAPSGKADWILYARRPQLKARVGASPARAFFRRRFVLAHPLQDTLEFSVFRAGRVFLDGRLIGEATNPRKWSENSLLALDLSAGAHELSFDVQNDAGPAAVKAAFANQGLPTGADWQASEDGGTWTTAMTASRKWRPAGLGDAFPDSLIALRRILPELSLFFSFGFLWSWALSSGRPPRWVKAASSLSSLRWILIGAWLALGAAAVIRLNPSLGFDVASHLKYVYLIAKDFRLPSPSAGTETFQPPLFYLLSAPWLVLNGLQSDAGFRLIRLIPLLCGAAQIELSRRAAAVLAPDRRDLQALGMLAGSLLPVNLYMSQFASNEPLCAALSGLVLVLALSRAGDFAGQSHQWFLRLGLVWGLALLAKPTAVLLSVPLVWLWLSDSNSPRSASKALAGLLAAFSVCGWFYLRNWLLYGAVLSANWAYRSWWQDPGFLTPGDFWFHASTLSRPVFAAFSGFWDGLYSTLWLDGDLSGTIRLLPPWDYNCVLAGAWLALPMTAALMAGAGKALSGRAQRPRQARFCLLTLGVYLAALIVQYWNVPIFASVKASYALGAIPCLAALIAEGFSAPTSPKAGRLARAASWGMVACWSLAAYAAYFAGPAGS